ncbi:MAG: M12 family metallo-peptidase [Acidobacteriota bacterium]
MKKLNAIMCAFLNVRFLVISIIAGLVAVTFTATALMQSKDDGRSKANDKVSRGKPQDDPTAGFWQSVSRSQAISSGQTVEINATQFSAFSLNRDAMQVSLTAAPLEFTTAARQAAMILSIPAPDGKFQRFEVVESPVMEQELAAKHPEIKTYSGTGIDDPGANIRFDLTPLGFHASIRGSQGNWYIDPLFHLDQSVYASYYGRNLLNTHGPFSEGQIEDALGTADLTGGSVKIAGRYSGTLGIENEVASVPGTSPQLATGDQLRTYRLALLTDPSYAAYFGGSANVTAAKVTLINRVDQVYGYDLSIRMVLIGANDLLNLDTAAQITGTNGPCGGAACFTASQIASCTSSTLSRNRVVIGEIVGASSFDVGHIGLGVNGGGVASLGVVGGSSKAQGCTGIPTPVGDFYAVDYVAHEMGHQFAGNHTFNGTISNCSTSNRNAGTSVEPGSGSSVMAYAGICGTDNMQPHSDPYFSERSFDEITTYTSAAETNLNEVQMGVLTGFAADGQQFQIRYNGNNSAAIVRGTNFTTAGVKAAVEAITGWPAGGTVTVSTLGDTAFTITFGGTVAGNDVSLLSLVNPSGGATGFVAEITKGGLSTKGGATTPTGDAIPTATAPIQFTIPIRTPFALTGSGADADNDTLTYMWEQNDRGASGTSAGTGLITQPKLNGPLFRQFSVAAIVTSGGTIQYNSPGENGVTTNPTRVFPDMAQILANNTNAATGSCPLAVPATPTAAEIDCFSEFLPTADYVGTASVNNSPLSLNFRLTVRDGRGGVGNAPTQLLLTPTAGPFLVTSQSTNVSYNGGSIQTVNWDVANTAGAPINAVNVKISLSTDGGLTFPTVLAASTPNDGSEAVTMPNISTTTARLKIEAIGNVFFDVNDSNFTIVGISAADVSVSGRIFTQFGQGLLNAIVTVTCTDGSSHSALSSSLGYYSISHVAAGQSCTVSVQSKRFVFSSQTINLSDAVDGLDFTAQ